MPKPSTTQPANHPHSPGNSTNSAKPAESTQEEAISTDRPPRVSMARPTAGAEKAEISSAMEKAP
jgi:hypothetical protein